MNWWPGTSRRDSSGAQFECPPLARLRSPSTFPYGTRPRSDEKEPFARRAHLSTVFPADVPDAGSGFLGDSCCRQTKDRRRPQAISAENRSGAAKGEGG